MPYFIKPTKSGWDTVDANGKVLGSHPDKESAIKQMVAVSLHEKIKPGGELKRAVMAGSYEPPVGVQDAAKRALKWIADGKAGSGFTSVGRARAEQLASGKSVSGSVVNRMISYFARHEVDKKAVGFNASDEGYPSAGRVAWDAWGGDAGQSWVMKLDKEKVSMAAERSIVDAIGIVDLDGTLVVDGKVNEPVYKWIDLAKKDLWIVSGRPETDREDIIAELNRLGIEYQELVLSDGSISSVPMFKAATAENLLDLGYDIEYVIDADAGARAAYGEAGIQNVYDPENLPGVINTKRDAPMADAEYMPATDVEATEKTKADLAEELRELLGTTVSLKFLAHGAHWNVKGVLFSQYHEFFGDIYQDIDDIIDPLSENIRKLDFDSPFTLPQFVADTDIDATFVGGDPVDLSLALYKAIEIYKGDVAYTITCADALAEQGIYNFLADVQDRMSKWHWQLGAVIGDAKRDEYAVDVEEAAEGMTAEELSETPNADAADLKGRSTHAEIERRTSYAPIEMRAEGDGMTFTGYAALFNSPSEPLPFTETIKPGAFKRSLQSRNEVKLLWNHDTGTVLGSLRAGTLTLGEDERGLKVTAKLPDTQAGRDAAVLLKRGDVSAMSFGFRVPEGGDSWSADGTERSLNSVRLHEVSIVAFPAYQATDGQASVRSFDAVAERANVDASELTEAILALESDAELTERQAELITTVAGKLVQKLPEQPAGVVDLLAIKKKQLDLMLKKE
jgi:HK97 family phage prohead protease